MAVLDTTSAGSALTATDDPIGHPVEPVGIENAEHYRWAQVCDGWHLLKRDDFSVIRERVPPGASETRHRHARARQFFYVLDGAAVIEIEGVRHPLASGQGLHVPPGAPHQVRNESAADVHFLVVSVPKSHGDRENLEEAGASP
jgi:mannose-6-phosphate isomerase-like protein (cupin superfamily)